MREFHAATYADPNNPDALYNLGRGYHRVGKVENRDLYLRQAEQYYHQCLDKQPNHGDCYRALAVLLAEQDRKDEAFRLVENWCDAEPTSANARIELARLREEYGDRAAAKQSLEEALRLDPDHPRALAALGRIWEEMGEPERALKDYQHAYARDPFQPQLASRISALQSARLQPTPATGGDSPTRLVERDTLPIR